MFWWISWILASITMMVRVVHGRGVCVVPTLIAATDGIFDHRIIFLSLLNFSASPAFCSDHTATIYYNNTTGVISGNFIRDTQQLMDVEYGNSIIMEDGSILYGDKSIVHNCMKAIGRSNPSCGELLPNTVDLFERSLNGDLQSIHTVFRLDRYLSYIIQNRQPIVALNYSMDTTTTTTNGDDGGEQQHEWNHYSKLIPMKQMCKFSLFLTMATIK